MSDVITALRDAAVRLKSAAARVDEALKELDVSADVRRIEKGARTGPALSAREQQIFTEMGKGIAPKEIAENLKIARKTVEGYRDRIRQKFGGISSRELQRRAVLESKRGGT